MTYQHLTAAKANATITLNKEEQAVIYSLHDNGLITLKDNNDALQALYAVIAKLKDQLHP